MAKKLEKILTVRERGQITLPFKFRKALGIEEDSILTITMRGGKMILTPLLVTTATKAEKPEKKKALPKKKAAPKSKKIKKQPVVEEEKQDRLF